jgi:putative endonuclease
MEYVYIIQCSDGTLYTGYAVDVKKRIAAHNKGTAAKYTRGRGPVQLRYVETCPDKSSALRRERAIKRLTREKKENLIQSVCMLGHLQE